MFKKEKPGEAGHIHPLVLALSIMSAEGIPTRWLDLDGVQERPQSLSKGSEVAMKLKKKRKRDIYRSQSDHATYIQGFLMHP